MGRFILLCVIAFFAYSFLTKMLVDYLKDKFVIQYGLFERETLRVVPNGTIHYFSPVRANRKYLVITIRSAIRRLPAYEFLVGLLIATLSRELHVVTSGDTGCITASSPAAG